MSIKKLPWAVGIHEDKVFIEPPYDIDQKYDDILLQITGNFLLSEKVEIAKYITRLLNDGLRCRQTFCSPAAKTGK